MDEDEQGFQAIQDSILHILKNPVHPVSICLRNPRSPRYFTINRALSSAEFPIVSITSSGWTGAS
jgi:hypothetical protein